ncbi:enoyl-CoA hydratase-related protein [uncultured Enterovirga sp.]|uniref:enoyl-CoA hydratase-related protein n=1 Tax=uncultured Enterovirga sp. TaxID=2026352 RepID=UPI0035CBACFF
MVRLSNPSRRNAVSVGMWRALAAFSAEVSARSDIYSVVLRGEGERAFSAGADITDFADHRNASDPHYYDDLVETTCRAIEAIPQPVVAMIYGACLGAGSSLAASCDLRLAASDAFFAVPAGRLGLGYDPRGVKRFVRTFGGPATTTLLYTAGRIGAERAHQLGGVHEIAPAEDLEATAEAILGRIEANAPLTLRAAKLALRAVRPESDPALFGQAVDAVLAADRSDDYVEGRAAFAERRPPRFVGA